MRNDRCDPQKFMNEEYDKISMFRRAFFNSIIVKHQHMHITFNSILV